MQKLKIDLLQRMLYLRLVEESIANKYPENKMRCPTHLSIGQEAVAVGVCAHLNNQDPVFSTHRCHGHYLAKGGNLKRMLAEIYGKATGCSRGKGGSMHLIDLEVGFMGSTAIVANSVPLAVGAAYASKIKKEKNISCTFFGDAAIEEGIVHEALNFAALKKLPVLFICENNLYSVYTPLKQRRAENALIHKLAEAHGIKTLHGNGQDVLEVYDLVAKAKDFILSGNGPFFLELDTYRYREHCGPNFDNTLGYRTLEEYQAWLRLDPIDNLLKSMPEFDLTKMQQTLLAEIEEAHRFADSSPFPDPNEAFLQIYQEQL